jgi:hypothetical protein
VAYGARLESVLGVTALEGSNPSPSAMIVARKGKAIIFISLCYDTVNNTHSYVKHMLKQYFSKRTKRTTQQVIAALVILLVASVGTYLLTSSHAANPYAATTAYTGTLTGPATQQSCTGATNSGNCVVFGRSSSSSASCTQTADSVASAESDVASASGGSVICVSAGSYGAITLSGSPSSNVTLEPNPAQDPTAAGKVTFAGIQVNASNLTVNNFYSSAGITVGTGGGNDVISHNDVTNSPGGYGISVLPNSITSPVSNVTITGNDIHDLTGTAGSLANASTCNYGDDGDAIRLDGWTNITITDNEETGIEQVPPTVVTSGGTACEGHTDCLQSYNADNNNAHDFIYSHNYIYNNQCEGPPFLKDGDVTSDVAVNDNLDVDSNNKGLSDTSIFLVENTPDVMIRNNTFSNTGGSDLEAEGTTANPSVDVEYNVFDQINFSGYALSGTFPNTSFFSGGLAGQPFSEGHNIYTGGNEWSFNPSSTDTYPGQNKDYSPSYQCGSNCTGADANYELTSLPSVSGGCASQVPEQASCIGVDWNPSQYTYGPTE